MRHGSLKHQSRQRHVSESHSVDCHLRIVNTTLRQLKKLLHSKSLKFLVDFTAELVTHFEVIQDLRLLSYYVCSLLV